MKHRLTFAIAATATVGFTAVGAAGPAFATTNVLWYIENDQNYTFTGDGYAIYAEWGTRDGDSLPIGIFDVSVPSGDHQYMGWGKAIEGNGNEWEKFRAQVSLPLAQTANATYPLDYVCMEIGATYGKGWGDVQGCDGKPIPDYVQARSALVDEHVDFTWTLTWQAPTEQEADLTDLAEMDADPSECTITGTDGDDVIEGTDGDDVICAGDGDDVIDGKGGDDVIIAGPGDDTVDAGDGDDIVKGGSGDDEIAGGDGDDTLGGGSGNDRVDGGSGDDAMHGATGEDVLVGGSGDDLTDGGAGEDALLPDATAGAEQDDRQLRHSSMAHQARNYIRHSNTLASTDALGNFLEDGDGDGMSAQGY